MPRPLILNWVPVGAGKLALAHRPGLYAISTLHTQGCTRVVTLLSEREHAQTIGDAVQAAQMAWSWLPLQNGKFPQAEAHSMLLAALPVLSACLDRGEAMMIHCAAGIHRTGMVTYALLRWRGLDQAEALEVIGKLRPHTREGIQPRQIAWGNRYAVQTTISDSIT